MRSAASEIRQLRHQNEILSAKVEVMDLFAMTLRTEPKYQTVGYGEDIAWQLDEKVRELEFINANQRKETAP